MKFDQESDNNPLKLPIVDISKPLSSSCLASLAVACKEWGFFQIINHGISKDLYTAIHSLSNNIFCLPSHSKILLKTYTPHFIASPFFESIRVSGPHFAASAQNSVDALGQLDSSQFSEVLEEYGSKVSELSKTILKVVLATLGEEFEAKYYDSEFNNCHGYLRINNYTPPLDIEEEAEGLGMHTDMSCLTIVFQDQIGGLQVRSKDGKWMNIVPCEDTLVVNIGDMLQAWSNDRLRSSQHRVVLNKPVNRFSLAFFWCFHDDKLVSAPDELVKGQERACRVYKPFVCSDYVKFRESDQKGRFDKVGFTVKDFAGISY